MSKFYFAVCTAFSARHASCGDKRTISVLAMRHGKLAIQVMFAASAMFLRGADNDIQCEMLRQSDLLPSVSAIFQGGYLLWRRKKKKEKKNIGEASAFLNLQ